MKKTKTTWVNLPAEKIELEKNETMCLFWNELKKDTNSIITYGNSRDDIMIVYHKKSKTIAHISVNNVLLFNTNYRVEVRDSE